MHEDAGDLSVNGRGSNIRPANRFDAVQLDSELEYLEHDSDAADGLRSVRTRYYPDASKSIVSENDSPDIYFNYSINPYRGCAHGCSYCYARPSHEYLGMGRWTRFRIENPREARCRKAASRLAE